MRVPFTLPFAVGAAIAALPLRAAADAPNADGIAFFEAKIRPVLVAKCYDCHSAKADDVKGGLLLDTRAGIRAGGDSGHAVVPGKPGESLLIEAIRYADKDTQMPPKKSGGKLPDAVIADFEAWVRMGAPDPREGAPAQLADREIDWAKAREFWAFQPPQPAPLPTPADTAWPRTDLDRFILASLEAKGMRPVADAEPRALLRRLSFDLTGLPPAPEAAELFHREWTAAASPESRQAAVARAVDALLASPRFGERWGRHWLDVARFAESTGRERNFTFPTAWRYRDWVIDAINADVPYDAFVRAQIAGDLLPARDAAERDRNLIATGFLALGPKGLNERNREQFRMDLVDDQIDATTRGVLGLTVACARCHDHKFDPIPTRDYYAMAGIFRSTDTHYGTGGAGAAGRNRNASTLLALSAAEKTSAPDGETPRQRLAAYLAENPGRAKKLAKLPPARKAKLLERFGAAPAGPAGKTKRGAASTPAAGGGDLAGKTMGVQEARPGNARVLVRGEVDQPSETVPRGVPTLLAGISAPKMPANASGRLELAQWLTAPENPLTARVLVNRVWQHLFGQGFVATPDNFGMNGAAPNHRELLDHLALQFVRDGWSLKKLVRAIVLSRTYQLGATHDAASFAIDPDNRRHWRMSPRRLDAESIRDAMLAASGQLDLTPPAGSAVARAGDGYIGRGLQPAAFQAPSLHRSVYLPIVRNLVPEVLEVFDFAEPSLVVAARDVTNVPAQALFLMNNDFVIAQSRAMAKRVLATPLGYGERIALAYELALARPPTAAERSRADRYLRAEATGLIPVQGGRIPEASEIAWATFCQALFACAEFRYLQ